MSSAQVFAADRLFAAGLNLQAVFDIAGLPPALRGQLAGQGDFRQLILLGHGGRALWDAIRRSGIVSADPIDDFTRATVDRWFAEEMPTRRYRVLYPGDCPVGLQALGKLAGWHHDTPFMVGVNASWGSWYAYRAVVLADTNFVPTPALTGVSPCLSCLDQPCIAACPGEALAGGEFALAKCIAWRRQPASTCATACLARIACPVAAEHRYCGEQIRHSYAISLRMIEEYY